MRQISNEKRELIISAKNRKEKNEDIAVWLEISISSVKRIWRIYKETETIEPKKRPGRKPVLDDVALQKIKVAVKKQPDITLEELIETLNLPIKKSRLSVILIGLGLTFKKRHCLQKNN